MIQSGQAVGLSLCAPWVRAGGGGGVFWQGAGAKIALRDGQWG
jgi:hypothetical protein